MSGPTTLREEVASALYNEPTKSPMNRIPWEQLPEDRKAAWLDDADRVIPIVAAALQRGRSGRSLDTTHRRSARSQEDV